MNPIKRKKPVPGRSSRRQTPEAKNSVYSYYQNRTTRTEGAVRSTPDPAPKRSKRFPVQHVPTFILVIAILISVVFLSTVDPNPRMVFLDGEGNQPSPALRDEAVYQEAAARFINDSIVNRSKFMIDTNGLESYMRNEFPELAAVSVTIPIMGRRPVIDLQATRPAFILQSSTGSYLVGNNGVALIKTSDLRSVSKLNVPTVQDESGINLEPGKAALPSEQATFISTVLEQLTKQSIEVESLTIPTSPYDLHIKIKDKPYFVKFNILEDPLQQAGSFVALSRRLEQDRVEPKEYIDVRAGERVFYR